MTFPLPLLRRVVLPAAIIIASLVQANAQAPVVQKAVYFDVSPPLRDIQVKKPPFWKKWTTEVEKEIPNKRHIRPVIYPELMNQPDGALQQFPERDAMEAVVAPSVNFEGLDNSDNTDGRVTPPDPAGDVGPGHYVQAVNCMLLVFSKSGGSLYGPVPTSTLWTGFNGAWTGHNDGDALVMYDELADRWIISQFAVDCGTYPNYTEYELVAVSKTSDPTGEYYRYAFQFDHMPDYPKLGVWRDGYYISVNRFNTNSSTSPFVGAAMGVMERDKMLAGDPAAKFVYFKSETLGGSGAGLGSDCFSMLPGDCDGTFAPAGTPNYFTYMNDDAWGGNDELRIWSLKPDWTNTAASTCTFVNAVPSAAFATFDTYVIKQKGVSLTLDDLSDRLMHRLQYRNMGSYESMVTCHTVNSGSNIAGVRWYELRKSGSSWSMYQQGTYAPGDSKSRWMGSAAMNATGDIAVGYTVSGATAYPSIYFTGRRASDALGTLTVTESPIKDGAASMTGADRWGDYAMMSVDPADNKTFWHTNMYVGTYGGTYPWATRIAAFAFSNAPLVVTLPATAVTAASATLNGTVNPSSLSTNYYFEWGTTTAYGTSTTPVSAGSGSADVAASTVISGLAAGATYHFRAAATNSDGTSYGNDFTFIAGTAVVTTAAVTGITAASANVGGEVLSDGGSTVTRGVCYGTSVNPTISNAHTTDGTGTGVFSSTLTGLSPETVYHARAYATNAAGTSYGADVTFTTGALEAPVATAATSITGSSFNANWNAVSGATSYALDVSLYPTFTVAGGSTTLTEGFSGGITPPSGWIFTNIGATYTTTGNYGAASPSLKLDATGDAVETPTLASAATQFKFWYKGQSTNTTSALLIEGYDGTAWQTVDNIKPLSTSALTVTYNATSAVKLPPNLVKFRFSYSKSAGNLALDDVSIIYGGSVPSFVSGYENLAVTNVQQAVSGLSNNTAYYYRVRAKNGSSTSANSNVITLTTTSSSVTTPSLTTTAVTAVAQTTAASGGTISTDGGATVTARGVCWSTSANPTVADSKTTDGTGTGTFSSAITGLTAATAYHVRAYATNSAGTAYGSDIPFTTAAAVTIPSLTTTAVTAVTQTTAASGGTISTDGGAAVTLRGVCWSTSANPTVADSKTTDGTGTGSFTSAITGLTAATAYHVRAYATNSAGTAYGSDVPFTTAAAVTTPSLTTTAVTAVTQTTAASGGTISTDGGAAVTARGVCWSTSANPTVADSKTADGAGTGSFTSAITGLTAATAYHVRAYATNSAGTAYGSDIPFTTAAAVTIPALTTTAVTAVTQTTAASGGTISTDGGAAVTARGVCWSGSLNPTIADSKTSSGAGTGAFTSAISGLTAGTLYHVRAYATNSAGTAYGNDVNFTTSPLAAPVALAAMGITDTKFTANWNPSEGAAGYLLTVSTDNSFSNVIPGYSSRDVGNVTLYVVSGLQANTAYYYRVSAYAGAASSGQSNTMSVTTGSSPVTLPVLTTAPVTGVTFTAALSGGTITSDGGGNISARGVCWDAAAAPTTAGQHTTDGTGAGTFTSSITGLTPATAYHVRAYAINSAGTAYGNEVMLDPAVLSAPVASEATQVTVDGFTANWNAVNNAGGYRIDVATDHSFGSLLSGYSNLDVNSNVALTLSGLNANTAYYYRVRAYYLGLTSANSNTIAVNTLVTGVSPAQETLGEAYSYQKTIYVNLRDNSKGSIYIYSISGELLRTLPATLGTTTIQVYAPGVYLVKVITPKVNMVKHVVIE